MMVVVPIHVPVTEEDQGKNKRFCFILMGTYNNITLAQLLVGRIQRTGVPLKGSYLRFVPVLAMTYTVQNLTSL